MVLLHVRLRVAPENPVSHIWLGGSSVGRSLSSFYDPFTCADCSGHSWQLSSCAMQPGHDCGHSGMHAVVHYIDISTSFLSCRHAGTVNGRSNGEPRDFKCLEVHVSYLEVSFTVILAAFA